MAGFACGAGVTGFGVSALGVAGCGAGVAGFVCAGGVAAVPGFCGFAFTATSAGIVLGTGWLPVIRVPFALWGILVITGAADAP